MRITQEQFIQFARLLESKAQERHPEAYVEIKQAPTGHYVVIMHTDKTLQCESECYTIDPISRDWVKTYGTF